MSTTIDQRVVEMRFDNKHFEQNTKQTMSTLERLKRSLNLTGASKGLENISSASKKINFNPLCSAVESVQHRFSALEVMGVTALANLTNSAVNYGKKIANALTLDPVKTGFQEYETQINAVQTILSNTRSKGTTIDQVNEALDELNTYADKTIYNFTEMTRNIGTFTAAGVDLDKSVQSIKGIANLAAVSGSTSQQASTAMYQLSQALAAGKVSLMDWNSVVNAGMGGELFQNALIRTSELLGTGAKNAIKTYGTFRESLTKGQWLTAEVLTETLAQLSGAYTEADLIAQGYTKEQAKEIAALAKDANEAATVVKTFTQLWDTLKESVQSGWTQTWELLVGDYEEAKKTISQLSNFLGGFIEKFSNARNKLLGKALGNPFEDLAKKIDKVTGATKAVTNATKDFSDIVNKVIRGDFGNGQARYEALSKAGYDWAHIQNLVNEKLGSSVRHATKYKEAQNGVNKSQAVTIEQLVKMSDAELVSLGLTQDQIQAFRELEKQSKKTGIPIEELVKDLSQLNGRTLLINSFKNAGQGLVAVLKAVKDAYREIFPAMKPAELYDIIAAIHKFSTYLKVGGDTAEKVQRTFRGLFALVDILATIFGGGLRLALKIFCKLLNIADLDILDLTANLGDLIYNFRKLMFENDLVNKGLEKTIEIGGAIIRFIKKMALAFYNLPQVQAGIQKIKDKMLELYEIGKYAIEGFINGVKDGSIDGINAFIEFAKTVLDKIREVFGIHSPSVVMYAIGLFLIAGLINGLTDGASPVISFLADFGKKCIETIKEWDWGAIFTVGAIAGLLIFGSKLTKAIETIANPLDSIGGFFETAGKAVKSFSLSIKAKAIFTIAKAIAILVGSLALMTLLDQKKLVNALFILTGLALVLGGLTWAIGKFGPKEAIELGKYSLALIGVAGAVLLLALAARMLGKMDEDELIQAGKAILALGLIFTGLIAASNLFSKDAANVGFTLILMSIAMLLMVQIAKSISKLDVVAIMKGSWGIIALGGIMLALVGMTNLVGDNMDKLGGTLIKMAAAMLLMVFVAKTVSKLDARTLIEGLTGIFLMGALMVGLIAMTRLAGGGDKLNKLGSTLLAMSIAMILMVGVCKLVSKLEAGEIIKGVIFIGMMALVIRGLVGTMNMASGNELKKVGTTLIMMAIAIGILAGIAALLSLLKVESLVKGILAVGALAGLMTLMIWATKGAESCVGNIVAMTVALGLMVIAVAALSQLDPKKLVPATLCVMGLMGMLALMNYSSKLAGGGSWKSMVAMLLAIPVLVFALAKVLEIISKYDIEDNVVAIGALKGLMMALAASVNLLGRVKSVDTRAIGAIFALAGVVIILAAIIGVMDKCNIQGSIKNAVTLSILLLAISGACVALGYVKPIDASVIPAMYALSGVVAILAVILGLLSVLKLQASLYNVLTLSAMLLALSGACVVLGFVKHVDNSAIVAMFALSGVVAILAVILGLMSKMDIQTSIPTAIALSVLIIALSVAANLLVGLGYFAGPAIVGAGALAAIVAILGAAMLGMAYFADSLSDDTKARILSGLDFLQLVSAEIGEVVGGFIGGVFTGGVEAIFASLPKLGEDLSDFMDSAQGFFDGLKGIDSSALNGLKILAESMLILGGASLVDALTSFIGNGGPIGMLKSFFSGEEQQSTLVKFADELTVLAEKLVIFSNTLSQGNFDSTLVESASTGAKALAEMYEALPAQGGWIDDIFGTRDLGNFGTQLTLFAKGMVAFSNAVKADGGIDSEAIKKAKDAAMYMADLQDEIEPMGGVLDFFSGKKDLAMFGVQLAYFGQGMVAFSNALKADGGVDPDAIKTAKDAGMIMAELQAALEPTKGVAQWFTGTTALDTFGTQLEKYGEAIANFSSTIVENGIDSDAIEAAKNAGIVMTELQKAIPEDKWFDGKVSIDDFGGQIKKYGEKLSEFSDEVSDMDTDAASKATALTNKIIGIVKKLKDLDVSGIDTFKKAVNSLAETDFTKFLQTFNESDVKMVSAGIKIVESLTKGIQSKGSLLTISAVDLISKFASGLQTGIQKINDSVTNMVYSGAKTVHKHGVMFIMAGIALSTMLQNGMFSQSENVSATASILVAGAVSSITSQYLSFYMAGSYIAEGLANGISANTYKPVNAAITMARATIKAMKEEMGIASPSKESYAIAKFIGDGMVNGLKDSAHAIYSTAVDMSDTVRKGLSNSIGRISDIINNDIDTQPTIRPVVDLTDVETSTGIITSLFNSTNSLGIRARVSSVDKMMSARSQNGSNDDVVSAINKLGRNIDRVKGDTYNVNGITYDDGSNIQNAVAALIRAVQIEGRV